MTERSFEESTALWATTFSFDALVPDRRDGAPASLGSRAGAQGWTPGWGADASEQDWADEGGYQYEEEFQESPAEASQDEAQDAEAPSEPVPHLK